jgi:hypothetical protein
MGAGSTQPVAVPQSSGPATAGPSTLLCSSQGPRAASSAHRGAETSDARRRSHLLARPQLRNKLVRALAELARVAPHSVPLMRRRHAQHAARRAEWRAAHSPRCDSNLKLRCGCPCTPTAGWVHSARGNSLYIGRVDARVAAGRSTLHKLALLATARRCHLRRRRPCRPRSCCHRHCPAAPASNGVIC